jgi:CxxC-x17-CxxC domain-containing protein
LEEIEMGYGGFRRGPRNFGPREMTKITCSECGKEAEVPFKPREGSPVYCRDCFMKKRGITPREPRAPQEESQEPQESEEEPSE